LAWHRERHVEDLALIDSYFDKEAWEHELVELPGKYAPPKGSLLSPIMPNVPLDAWRCMILAMALAR
jgi:hypothetical protein